MNDYHILMGAIIKSKRYDPVQLSTEFHDLVSTCNERFSTAISSPYTILFGDEFQGVATTSKSMLEAIFYLEEASLNRRLKYKIKYVGLQGKIETAINTKSANGMMGEGLAAARRKLVSANRGKPRFQIVLKNNQAAHDINRLLLVVDGIMSHWNIHDGPLIVEMLQDEHDSTVGEIFNKTRSQIWKRRKTLQIQEYSILKSLILERVAALQVSGDEAQT